MGGMMAGVMANVMAGVMAGAMACVWCDMAGVKACVWCDGWCDRCVMTSVMIWAMADGRVGVMAKLLQTQDKIYVCKLCIQCDNDTF